MSELPPDTNYVAKCQQECTVEKDCVGFNFYVKSNYCDIVMKLTKPISDATRKGVKIEPSNGTNDNPDYAYYNKCT